MLPPNPIEAKSEGSIPRRRRLPIVGALLVSLAIGAVAGAVVGVRHEDAHWALLYDQSVADLSRTTANVAHWETESQQSQRSSDLYHGQLQDLQKRIATTVGNLTSPHFGMWTACTAAHRGCALRPGEWLLQGIPDTFTLDVTFRSTVPTTVSIMSISDYACWKAGACPWHAVGWGPRATLKNGTFHGAEGCGGYVALFYSAQAGTIYPDVSITRHPADHPTGACR